MSPINTRCDARMRISRRTEEDRERGERERERERRDQARFGESSHVNAIVNVMRIARKIKYRHGHSSLPFPQLTSSIEFRNSCTAYAGLFHSRPCVCAEKRKRIPILRTCFSEEREETREGTL